MNTFFTRVRQRFRALEVADRMENMLTPAHKRLRALEVTERIENTLTPAHKRLRSDSDQRGNKRICTKPTIQELSASITDQSFIPARVSQTPLRTVLPNTVRLSNRFEPLLAGSHLADLSPLEEDNSSHVDAGSSESGRRSCTPKPPQ